MNRKYKRMLHSNPDRIISRLEKLASLSEGGHGVTRLAYTALEREAHALVSEWFTELGCTVNTDSAGNTIATRSGSQKNLGAIGSGSHLDSVYEGGAFDGITGVVAALEVAEMLNNADLTTRHDFKFICFAGEEGARFGQACLGSKFAAGLSTVESTANLVDRNGVHLGDAMSEVGLDLNVALTSRWDPAEWSAFVELHVEQGSSLERAGVPLGIVDTISGSTRLQLVFKGVASHTGGTQMQDRADALVAAAYCIQITEQTALETIHRGLRATVGRLSVNPNSITTIPGEVTLTIDVRDVDADRQRTAAIKILHRTLEYCEKRHIELEVKHLADVSPVVLPMVVRQFSVEAARERGVEYKILTSGASHDAQMMNSFVPTGMIFVPSHQGLSHVPGEYTSADDIALGAEVLATCLLKLDDALDGTSSSFNTKKAETK